MQDLSLHLLDVVENSLRAGARHVAVHIDEDRLRDRLTVEIEDDGTGMTPETARRALDPFFTTKEGKRVGLGLPLLAQAAREAGGSLRLAPRAGGGTVVVAVFQLSHPDCKPLGDVDRTLRLLRDTHPEVEFLFRHTRPGAREGTR